MRRLLLAAGRARAAGASARARLAKFERVLPPGRLKAAGRQYSPRKARTGCSGCCAGGRCAGRCCAGWRAVRPPAAAAPAPSLAGAARAQLCWHTARVVTQPRRTGGAAREARAISYFQGCIRPFQGYNFENPQRPTLLVTLSISRLSNTKCCDRGSPISFLLSFLGPCGHPSSTTPRVVS